MAATESNNNSDESEMWHVEPVTVRWRVSLTQRVCNQSTARYMEHTSADAPRAFPLRVRLFSIFHVCGVEKVVGRTHAESGRSKIEFVRDTLTQLPQPMCIFHRDYA
jgi:hypothetical protein